jgi:hypothetical protein
MISIPVDFPGVIVANKPKPASSDIRTTDMSLPVWAISLIASTISLLIVSFVAYVYHDLSGEITKVQTSMGEVSKALQTQQISIAKLETSMSIVLKKPQYESNAKAAGFTNPQRVFANLQPRATFESRTAGQKGDYFISYTILSYDPATGKMLLRMDARLPNGSIYNDNTIGMQIRIGEIVELTRVLPVDPYRIYLQVIDIPATNQAILAIGPKSDEGVKRS